MGTAILTAVGSTAPEDAVGVLTQPTFRLSASGATGSELNVGVNAEGAIFVGGWNHIARSYDDGLTWTRHPIANLGVGKVGGVQPPFTGGAAFAADRVLIVDKETGRVFVDDTDLGCTVLAWSDDDGATWELNHLACGGGVTDHQKIAVGKRTALADPTGELYPNIVYVCANGLTHTPCAASVDGGRTFGPGMPSQQFDYPDQKARATCAFQGVPVAGPDGTLYQPRTQCGAALWWSADNALTWASSDLPLEPSPDAADVAVTPDGTVYFFATDKNFKPVLLRSPDGGETWEGPFAVDVPGTLASALFPSIVAGDDGRIALAFYGTTDDSAVWNKNPGQAPATTRWHGYVAIVTDAASATPTITPVRVTPAADPLQIGCLSKLGGCLGNIADYMDVDVGPDGRVVAVFMDGCPATCTTRAQSNKDDGLVAVQLDGPTLKAPSAPAAPGPAKAPAPPSGPLARLGGLLGLR